MNCEKCDGIMKSLGWELKFKDGKQVIIKKFVCRTCFIISSIEDEVQNVGVTVKVTEKEG